MTEQPPRGTYTRVLLTGSAAYLFGGGVVLNFFPQEVAAVAGLAAAPSGALLLQVVAGLYVGMGLTNWMWRDHLIGGIYGRPIGVGNVAHFTVGAFALGRAAVGGEVPPFVWAVTGVYVLFALAFGWTVFFRNPIVPGGAGAPRR